MAEDSGLERTEPASQQRLDKAREEGDVPRSRELSTCMVLLASGGGLYFFSGGLITKLSEMLTANLSFEREIAFDSTLLISKVNSTIQDILIAFSPLALLVIIAALGAPLLIGGWLFSAQALQPKFSRMNPISGLGNMISKRALVELIKALLKTLVIGVISWIAIQNLRDDIFGLMHESYDEAMKHLGSMLLICFLSIVGGLVIIAGVDAPFQMWSYAEKLKMTHQEVIQESKEANGNPQIKAKIRAQQREMARRRMMSEVPTADVIVTNPTHYSVALKYAEGKFGAPRVVAKGADAVAAKIKELGKEHNVPILEAPPLARALFKHTELGDEIPETLYSAVAEVLAYVFQLKNYQNIGGIYPEKPSKLQVPPELDPQNQNGVTT
jgi:flagellar biosynthetic protein FlhB